MAQGSGLPKLTPAGTVNGSQPSNKGKASPTIPTGNSLPNGPITKVPPPTGAVK